MAVDRSRRARAARKRTRRLGRLRLLRGDRRAAPARLRARPLPRRSLHAHQHRARLPVLQREQVQRRGDRLAAAQAPRRADVPRAAPRDQHRAHPAVRRPALACGAMAHPRMYQDDDPYLTELREVLLAFPEAVEVEAWGRPTFRAGKKIFGVFSGIEERPWGLIFKPDDDEREALAADERFY